MKQIFKFFGLTKKREMTLDEYIISIRPKERQLSSLYTTVEPLINTTSSEKEDLDKGEGPEEAGCLVPA
jgi:hypothetical protein